MFCTYYIVALVLKFRPIAFAILYFIYGHANKAFVVVVERPLAQKKSRVLEMLGSFASRSLNEDSVEIVSDEDDKGNIEYMPRQGEFVNLVAANSTETIYPLAHVSRIFRLGFAN